MKQCDLAGEIIGIVTADSQFLNGVSAGGLQRSLSRFSGRPDDGDNRSYLRRDLADGINLSTSALRMNCGSRANGATSLQSVVRRRRVR